MRGTNLEDQVSKPQKKSRIIGVILSSVLLLGALLAAYFVMRTGKEQPRALVSDSQATMVTVPIQGMSCASCVAQVKKKLKSMDGVTEVEVSLEHRNARVRYLDGKVLPEHLVTAINDLGYKAGSATAETAK